MGFDSPTEPHPRRSIGSKSSTSVATRLTAQRGPTKMKSDTVSARRNDRLLTRKTALRGRPFLLAETVGFEPTEECELLFTLPGSVNAHHRRCKALWRAGRHSERGIMRALGGHSGDTRARAFSPSAISPRGHRLVVPLQRFEAPKEGAAAHPSPPRPISEAHSGPER